MPVITDESQTDERPRWRRSALWDRADKIRELIERGYSYAQIVRMLRLPVGPRRLCTFCLTQLRIKSIRPSRHSPERKSAPPASRAACPPPPAQQVPPPRPLDDLAAEDESGDLLARLQNLSE